jgi:hypothetical protein
MTRPPAAPPDLQPFAVAVDPWIAIDRLEAIARTVEPDDNGNLSLLVLRVIDMADQMADPDAEPWLGWQESRTGMGSPTIKARTDRAAYAARHCQDCEDEADREEDDPPEYDGTECEPSLGALEASENRGSIWKSYGIWDGEAEGGQS